jgi:molybdate transport system regulatory protein
MQTEINIIVRTDGGDVVINSTVIRLLNNIQIKGSITGAAKISDLSYKRAWDLLDNLNTRLTHSAISTEIGGTDGGGTHLTETGRQILSAYNTMVSSTTVNIQEQLNQISGLVQ